MASIGHIAIGLVARRLHRQRPSSGAAVMLGMTIWVGLSMLPDLDVIGFRFGVAYSDPWGHRGATHSLAFAALLGIVGYLVALIAKLPPLRTGLLVAAVVASHTLLDTLTDGGLGCALLWPFCYERFFAPWRPIPVAPIGKSFFSPRGLYVAVTELALFLPLFVYAFWPSRRRRGAGL